MPYSEVTLTGTHRTPDKQPASGVIEIIPSEPVIVDREGNVVLSGRVKVRLDEQGHYSVSLPATDDPTLSPTGFGYTVVAKLHHGHLKPVSFPLPAAEPLVDIADVTTVDPSTFVADANYVTPAELDAAVAGVVVDTSGLASAADVDALDTRVETVEGEVASKVDQTGADALVATLAGDPASETGQVLAATIATGTVARSAKLAQFRADLANSRNARCTVMCLGDSITEGDDATTEANRWLSHLRRILQRGWPSAVGREAVGYLPVNHFATTFAEAWTITGTYTENNNWGPGGRALRMEPGSSATATLTGTSVDILFGKATFTGPMEVLVDGVSQGLTQTAVANNVDGNALNVALPAGGTHTVTVRPADAFPIIVEGAIVNDGNETSGVRVIDAGHWGWTSTLFAPGGNGGTSLGQVTATLAPSLLTIALTANDYKAGVSIATYTANMQAIITKARASGADPDILLIAYPERSDDMAGGPLYAEYVDALRDIAAADAKVDLLDLRNFMGPVASDTLGLWGDAAHPTDKGHALIAEHVAGYLLAGMHPVPRPAEPESLWVSPQQMTPTSGSPAVMAGGGAYIFMAFDATAQEQATHITLLPASWTKINVELVLGNPSASAGDAVMRCNLRQITPGGTAEATLFDVTKIVTAGTQNTSGRVLFATDVPVNAAKTTLIHVIRMAAGSGDTLGADFGLVGIRITRAA